VPSSTHASTDPRHLRQLTFAVVVLSLGPGRARAQEHACFGGRLTFANELDERWSQAIDEACRALEGAEDADPEISLHVTPDGELLLIEAFLPDGRHAARHVASPDGLLPTLEALTLLPIHGSPPPQPAPAPSEEEEVPVADVDGATPPSSAAASLGVELGGYGGVRGYGPRPYVGAALGGYAMLRVGAIGLAFTMRWEPIVRPIDLDASAFEMSSFAIGFAATRRFRPNTRLAFDVGGGAQIVSLSQHYDRASGEVLHSDTDARVGAIARMLVGRGRWAYLVTLDAELSPERTIRPRRLEPDLPPLPGYSFGLSTGVAWGTR